MNRPSLSKILVEVCRLLLGAVFLFSGAVKAVDPQGGAIKIADYLSAFGLDSLRGLSLFFAFNLLAFEFALGVTLLLGVYRRYAAWLTLLMMGFLTPLTLYLALFDPVSDCGCFGDALLLSNWQTFYKNVILLAAALFLWRYNQRLLRGFSRHAYWFVPLWSYLFICGFAYHNYMHLPILDFRPYKIGINIQAERMIPEDAPQDEYRYSFVYEKEGVRKEFGLEDAPAGDSTWAFVESHTELLKQGYVPPISDFVIHTMEGEEVTDQLLDDPRPLFLLIAPHLAEADDEHIDEINDAYDYCLAHEMPFYCVTASTEEEIAEWEEQTGAEYPYLRADDTLLKTIIRSNPGLLLLREGTIRMKWHHNDIPAEEQWSEEIAFYLDENRDPKAQEEGRLITNLLTFTVPLSLIWLYDLLRHRIRSKKRKRTEGKETE